MPTQLQHLHAVRGRLGHLMAVWARHDPPALTLGLGAEALSALRFVRHPAGDGGRGHLTLGFCHRSAPKQLPTWLRSPLDGEPVPVRALRVGGPGVAQGWVNASNATNHFLDGALGAILRLDADPARLLALTAGHVCGASSAAQRGDSVRFTSAGAGPAMSFDGELLDWQPNFLRLEGSTPLDAGIAEVDPAALAPLAAQPRLWPTGVAQAQAGESLRLRTRDLEIAGRGFDWINITLSVAADPSRSYVLRNAMAWRPSLPTQGGDSGSPLWNDAEQIVAIHAGGNALGDTPWAFAVPIGRVLGWVGASVVCRGERLRPAPSAPVAAPTVAAAAPVGAAPAAPGKREADMLARTMFGEARGEKPPGMDAVGHVVLNRVDARSWWGRDVIAVCLKPWQFSCWNAADPNRRKLLDLTAADPLYARAFASAIRLIEMQEQDHPARLRSDPTFGATHYYAPARIRTPAWAIGRTPCARIGGHDFFRDVA